MSRKLDVSCGKHVGGRMRLQCRVLGSRCMYSVCSWNILTHRGRNTPKYVHSVSSKHNFERRQRGSDCMCMQRRILGGGRYNTMHSVCSRYILICARSRARRHMYAMPREFDVARRHPGSDWVHLQRRVLGGRGLFGVCGRDILFCHWCYREKHVHSVPRQCDIQCSKPFHRVLPVRPTVWRECQQWMQRD